MESFNAGRVMGRAIAIWMRSIVPFTIVAFVCFLPLFAFDYFAVHDGLKMSPEGFQRLYTALAGLLGMVATGALTYGVFQAMRGQPASIGASLTKGTRRFLAVLGTSIVVGIAVGVGFVLLVVPGIIVLTMVYVAVPAAVIESIGGIKAANRSAELTKGHRIHVLGIAIVTFGVGFGAMKLYEAVAPLPKSPMQAVYYVFGITAVSALLAPFQAACSAVAYHDLRHVKDGADIDQLAAVFD